MRKLKHLFLFALTFLISFSALSQTDIRTLPPKTVLVKENITFTKDNFGVSYHYGNDELGLKNHYGQGFPVLYDYTPQDNPYPDADIMLDQYKSATWHRNFYPSAESLWNPTNGLGLNALKGLLDEADVLHNAGKKLLWTPAGFFDHNGSTTWDAALLSADFEQEMYDFHNDLLTSTYTNVGGLGYTFANHPAIAGYEPFNEQIRTSTANTYADVYARTTRIIKKLFEQYKSACKIITFTVQGGEGSNLVKIMRGDAVSIISPKLATNGDDGTGKTTADYLDVHAHHYYQEGLETKFTYDAWTSNNDFSSIINYYTHFDHALAPFFAEAKFNTTSPIYDTDISTIPIWNTESGICPGESTTAYNGGIRWFMFDEDEAFANLMKWLVPISFYLQDGSGGSGVNFAYKSDLPGISYTGNLGTNGTISNVVAGSGGKIRITTSKGAGSPSAPVNWLENMRIVIEAPSGGWSDLGLAAGEKKRYVTHVVDEANNILELKNTSYTAAPTGTINYTEYQLSHSPYPEEWKKMIDIMISGACSFGWIPYDDGSMGICIVTPAATYYTDENGNFKTW